MAKQKLLIASDDQTVLLQLCRFFDYDYNVLKTQNEAETIEKVKQENPDVVILDLGFSQIPPSISENINLLNNIINISPTIKVLVVTNTEENGARLIQLGAFDLFTKPIQLNEFRMTVKRALKFSHLEKKSNRDIRKIRNILGESIPMKKLNESIKKIAQVDIPVLILGESGTGKDLAAREIHYLSSRSDNPLISINCAAIPEPLFEAELFGYEKGAFTGAVSRQKGKLECANGGTIFLDEIGELTPFLQTKLLRFLQDHLVEHIGSHKKIYVDTRVIAATNRDIEVLRKNGTFRNDLYFRLAPVTLTIPPLRERGVDILTIARSCLKKYSKQLNRKGSHFSDDALAALLEYDWPGNIRELENKVKRAAIMAESREISRSDLDLPISRLKKQHLGFKDARDAYEKKLIEITLERENGMICQAAKELKISRQYLTRLITKYGINPKTV